MEPETDVDDQTLLEALGIKPAFVDDEGPPVDQRKLRCYVRGELGPFAAEEVRACVAGFRTWFEACKDVLR